MEVKMKQAYALPEGEFWQLPKIESDNLKAVLASNKAEIELAQSLRYDVFVNEIGAKPGAEAKRLELDFDEYDEVCDHLLVIDTNLINTSKNPVVGTYRLIRGTAAGEVGKFYSSSEYDVTKIARFDNDILELGRSCIHKDYRNKSVLQLLWRGIGAYLANYDIKLLFGCASFHGDDVDLIKNQLSYLYHNYLAPDEYRTVALEDQYINMNLVEKEECKDKSIRNSLPPLIKGYLGMGAFIGDGAVYDSVCNTIDVSIIVQTERLNARYTRRFVGA